MTSKTLNPEYFDNLLAELWENTRKTIREVLKEIEDIKVQTEEAAARGDFSENTELRDSLAKRNELEVRLSKLKSAEVDFQHSKERKKYSGYISLSSLVRIIDLETNTEYDIMIVKHDVAQFSLSLVSEKSPVALALEGKTIGDVVIVQTPKKVINYKVLLVM